MNTIDLYGDTTTFRMIANRTIDQYEDDELPYLGKYAFTACSSLTSISLPLATSLETYSLYDCRSLSSVNLPNVKYIRGPAFANCSSLTNLNLNNLTYLSADYGNYYPFVSGTRLTRLDLPKLVTIANSSIRWNHYLETISLPKCSALRPSCLSSNELLNTLIIGTDLPTITTLGSTDVFSGTKIAEGIGVIYVPSRLYDKYITATNWSRYASQIVAVSNELKPMIFYIDPLSDEEVTFYDQYGNPLSEVNVGDVIYNYTITDPGVSGRDKYYVYCRESIADNIPYGYEQIPLPNSVAVSFGSGKSNTTSILNTTDTSQYSSNSIWTWLTSVNNDQIGGYSDWYIPSKAELNELYLFFESIDEPFIYYSASSSVINNNNFRLLTPSGTWSEASYTQENRRSTRTYARCIRSF